MRKTTTVIFGIAVALVVAAAAFASDGSEQTNAARACRAERTAMGADAFKLLYGTLPNRSNAFGKCVSKHARAEQQATANSSRTCRTERESLGVAAFNAKYGRSEQDRSAFGKCVSQHAKTALAEQQEETVNAAKTCKAERKALGAEAFRAKYGTNRNKSNAFGKCVSKLVNA
jgi:hypothetical protein